MKSIRFTLAVLALVFFVLAPTTLRADGQIIRFDVSGTDGRDATHGHDGSSSSGTGGHGGSGSNAGHSTPGTSRSRVRFDSSISA